VLLLYPCYFAPISHYVAMAQANRFTLEVEDNYQKQTYRTRCYIYGANGKQLLNVPVKNANHKQKTKEIQIEEAFGWKQQHLKSMAAAYRSSPFYEYYEDELQAVFHKTPTFLLDLNLLCQEFIFDCLQVEPTFSKTTHFEKQYAQGQDLREWVNAKSKRVIPLTPYTQVFESKLGFLSDLSIVDLLFNEGPNALNYLQSQTLPK